MASHLGSKERYITIELALESIAKQTKLPDQVMVSYSYDLEEPNTSKWSDILGDIPHVFLKKDAKRSQFQHYFSLFEYVEPTDTIMFLDDDDLYHPTKVEIISNHIDQNIVCHLAQLFGNPYDENKITYNISDGSCTAATREYVCYCIKGRHLKQIIDRIDTNPSLGQYDLFFKTSMDMCENVKYIDDVLYYIRRDRIKRDYI